MPAWSCTYLLVANSLSKSDLLSGRPAHCKRRVGTRGSGAPSAASHGAAPSLAALSLPGRPVAPLADPGQSGGGALCSFWTVGNSASMLARPAC